MKTATVRTAWRSQHHCKPDGSGGADGDSDSSTDGTDSDNSVDGTDEAA